MYEFHVAINDKKGLKNCTVTGVNEIVQSTSQESLKLYSHRNQWKFYSHRTSGC